MNTLSHGLSLRLVRQKISILWQKIPREIRYVFVLFVGTRAVLIVIGVASRMILDMYQGGQRLVAYSTQVWLDIWGSWDTGWYLGIARHGYSPEISTGLLTTGQANFAFFPLYPMLVRLIGFFTGAHFEVGLILSNVFFLVGAVLFYRLAKLDIDATAAERAVLLLFLAPAGFIFSGMFTESLFFMLLVAVWYCARRGKWALAGIAGFLLALTRPIGVLILIPLVYEYLKEREFQIRSIKWSLGYLGLIPLGTILFLGYVGWLTGDVWSYGTIQHVGWKHEWVNPFATLVQGVWTDDGFRFVSGIVTGVFFLVLLFGFRSIRFSYWLTGLLLILVPLSSGVVAINSMLRYLLPVFPIYLFASTRIYHPWLQQTLIVILALFQGFAMAFWVMRIHLIV